MDDLGTLLQVERLPGLKGPFPIDGFIRFLSAQHINQVIIPGKNSNLFGINGAGILQTYSLPVLKAVKTQIFFNDFVEI